MLRGVGSPVVQPLPDTDSVTDVSMWTGSGCLFEVWLFRFRPPRKTHSCSISAPPTLTDVLLCALASNLSKISLYLRTAFVLHIVSLRYNVITFFVITCNISSSS